MCDITVLASHLFVSANSPRLITLVTAAGLFLSKLALTAQKFPKKRGLVCESLIFALVNFVDSNSRIVIRAVGIARNRNISPVVIRELYPAL